MNDFSQHGEQKHILKFFGDFKGRFLDIGAYDGISGSNTAGLAAQGIMEFAKSCSKKWFHRNKPAIA